VARVGIGEAPAAARVGLANALADLAAAESTMPAVHARIAALAAHSRQRLDGVAGWRVGEELTSQSGIVTLQPPAGVDPFTVRDRLYREARVLTSAIDVGRGRDLPTPLLRSSAHVYTGSGDIERLAAALDRYGRPAG
jgi:pyridoxal 5-phosphate dependent beta-lyase